MYTYTKLKELAEVKTRAINLLEEFHIDYLQYPTMKCKVDGVIVVGEPEEDKECLARWDVYFMDEQNHHVVVEEIWYNRTTGDCGKGIMIRAYKGEEDGKI